MKKLSQTYSVGIEAQGPGGKDQALSAPDLTAPDRTKAAGEGTMQPASVTGAVASPHNGKPDSAASHLSMPALATDQPEVSADGARERAATYCVSEGDRTRQQQQQQLRAQDGVDGESIEHIAEEFLDPTLLSIREGRGEKISPSSSTKSKNTLCCQSSACAKTKSSSSSSHKSGGHKLPSSPKSHERRGGKSKTGETIGVLCKQSMSFDLGVSLRAQSPEVMPRRPQSAESLGPAPGAEGGDKVKKLRPSSTSSEGEAVSASSDDKKKSRSRFLDSSWFQKPKKFFKVSK